MAKASEAGKPFLQVGAQSRLHGEQSLKFLFATILLVAAIGAHGAACLIDAVTQRTHSVAVGTSISEDGSKLEWDGTVARTAGQKAPPVSETNPSLKISWTKEPNTVGYLIQQRDARYSTSLALCTRQRPGFGSANRNTCTPALGADRDYAIVPNYMTSGMNWWVYAIKQGHTHENCQEQRHGQNILPGVCEFIGGVHVRCGEASSRTLSVEYSNEPRDVEDYELKEIPYPRGVWANNPTWNPAYQQILNARHGTNHNLCYPDGIDYEQCRCAMYNECGVSDPDPPDTIQPDPDPPPPPEEEDPKDPDPQDPDSDPQEPDPPSDPDPQEPDPDPDPQEPDPDPPSEPEPDDPQDPNTPVDTDPNPSEDEPRPHQPPEDAALYLLLDLLED